MTENTDNTRTYDPEFDDEQLGAHSFWTTFYDEGEAQHSGETIESVLEDIGFPDHGYMATAGEEFQDETGFAANIARSALSRVLTRYDEHLDDDLSPEIRQKMERVEGELKQIEKEHIKGQKSITSHEWKQK